MTLERRKNPMLVKIAQKYDNHPSARLFGKVVTDEPEEDSIARDFLKTLTPEILQATEQRLIQYGCTEREALALARVTTLEGTSTDGEVETAVIEALVSVKTAVEGVPDIEYLGGQNRGLIREGR